MTWTIIDRKSISPAYIRVVDRILEPSASRIAAMAKSLEKIGQISPISVSRNVSGDWSLITGATRLAAAKQLNWESIEALVISASDPEVEYKLLEIAENLDRYDLSESERSKLKTQEKELLKQRKKNLEKNGRTYRSRTTVSGARETTASADRQTTRTPEGWRCRRCSRGWPV